ncbi:hypothetical protein F2Q68_00039735 [Brassica cretica]|uniref:Uncharacterized protein n=1 Tax=Brassica cretica TaxID=69181 RepID=A0A8S9MPQ9_BRACR|nr:hypothetical protein F2Q68_00039735 [Brassica cretica]
MAWSLHSDRARTQLGRYVATELKPTLHSLRRDLSSLRKYRRLPSETIKQSAEPAETVASVLAGYQAGSARSSHRSLVPSVNILVAIHSCRDQNQSHQNKKDTRPPKEACNGRLA